MTNDLFSTIEVPSVEWDYLNGALRCDWNADEVFASTRAFEDMAGDFTRTERLAYLLTTCLTSH